ncbi:hypothetical protein PCANC_16643 [Puccinia coronata f. sp. avenae]|nr:hypothetical protein PCANC_16643 [Puccinia coronata f. sp. avenae]
MAAQALRLEPTERTQRRCAGVFWPATTPIVLSAAHSSCSALRFALPLRNKPWVQEQKPCSKKLGKLFRRFQRNR